MTEYLEKLILDNWEKWGGGEKPRHLDFLKTHAGNATRNKKVGLFVFNGKQPLIFVKTARERKYNLIVEDEYRKLDEVYRLLSNGSTPKPIYKGDYHGIIFTLESAVVGAQFHSFKKANDLNRFWEWFLLFQKLMILSSGLDASQANIYFNKIVEKFLNTYYLDGDLKKIIIDLAKSFEKVTCELVLINQHGDLTPDNVLDCNGEIKVIDWSNFKEINLPLFDLLVFLQRWSGTRDISFIHKYRPIIDKYLEEFNINKNILKRLVFTHYLLDFLRKKEQLENYDKEYLNQRLREIKDITK